MDSIGNRRAHRAHRIFMLRSGTSALAAALLSLHATEGAFAPVAARHSSPFVTSRRVVMNSDNGGAAALEAELATTRAEVRL